MEKVYALLWLADISDGIAAVGTVATVMLVLSVIVGGFLAAGGELDGSEVSVATRAFLRKTRWLWLIVPLAVLVPSAKTLRFAAAATAGQAAVATPLGDKAMRALDSVLDDILAKPKK